METHPPSIQWDAQRCDFKVADGLLRIIEYYATNNGQSIIKSNIILNAWRVSTFTMVEETTTANNYIEFMQLWIRLSVYCYYYVEQPDNHLANAVCKFICETNQLITVSKANQAFGASCLLTAARIICDLQDSLNLALGIPD